jgi:hypothetical protein
MYLYLFLENAREVPTMQYSPQQKIMQSKNY